MTEKQLKILIGSCLHDIGKVVYRNGDGRNHSRSGYDFLKAEIGITDKDILDCVRYHHAVHLKDANIANDSVAYLTYMADNIAAAVDRREAIDGDDGFDKSMPLQSVFNLLNGNQKDAHYSHQVLDVEQGIQYPTSQNQSLDKSFYQSVLQNLKTNLKNLSLNEDYASSLLNVLEANLSFIPSSTSKREQADISLYDHLKMTAAFALCMEAYFEEKCGSLVDYKKLLFSSSKEIHDEKMFLLYSLDISGIQKFIYTIASSGALRELRARSFYLDILMEHIIDDFLEQNALSRVNVVYSGGGHCYLLLPNTEKIRENIKVYEASVNAWFLERFGTGLYIAGGSVACSSNDLQNEPVGSYSNLFETMSRMISSKKMHRYSADQIRMLNQDHDHENDGRECTVCHSVGKLDQDKKCPICSALNKMSKHILYGEFFVVTKSHEDGALPLTGGSYLVGIPNEEEMKKMMRLDSYVRCYTKNRMYSGSHVSRAIWVGGYTSGDSFKEFSKKAEGIDRIAVLRADVDNLGHAFVHGFDQAGGDKKYVTLSRTATLSRQLSLFFKCHINHILKNGEEGRLGNWGERNVAIVYSGGDDLFLVGAWNDVIAAFIDLRNALERFTLGSLTISGGIGIYGASYPIHMMAKETERLENAAKELPGKNGITLFSAYDTSNGQETGAYNWDEFLSEVLGEKFYVIDEFFQNSDERGKAFIYRILDLLRNTKEKINRARYVYLLSRMEPGKEAGKNALEAYKKFANHMYGWYMDSKDRKQLITAIYLYVYLQRKEEV